MNPSRYIPSSFRSRIERIIPRPADTDLERAEKAAEEFLDRGHREGVVKFMRVGAGSDAAQGRAISREQPARHSARLTSGRPSPSQ